MRLLGVACVLSALLHLALVWTWPHFDSPVAGPRQPDLHIELRGQTGAASVADSAAQAVSSPAASLPTPIRADAPPAAAPAALSAETVRVLSTTAGTTTVVRAPLSTPQFLSPPIHRPGRPAQASAQTDPVLPAPAATPAATLQPASINHALLMQRWLERFQHYPRAARRARLEGEVLLSFQLLRSGHARAVKIVRSSGVALLDRAAITLLQRASPLPWPAGLQDELIEVEVPVRYLLDGTVASAPLP